MKWNSGSGREMFVSYAQNFEDVMLHRALQNIDQGFFIDIGAQDPIVDSVSQGFVELGWHGVNVEPSFTFAAKLKAYRPMDDLIEAVIGSSSDDVAFYDIRGTGLSTRFKQLAEKHRSAGYLVKERKVRSLTLDNLLDMYSDRDIHWLKIDAEGDAQDILNSWVSSLARPWIIVIEAVDSSTRMPTHHNWEARILQLGYHFVYFDGINRFYVSIERPELTKYFDHGPSYLDEFTLATTCSMNSAASLDISSLKIKLAQHKAVILAHRDVCKELAAETKHFQQLAVLAQLEIQRAQLEIQRAQSETRHFQQLASSAQQNAVHFERLASGLLESTSWRVTAPLRRISNAIHLLADDPTEFLAIAKSKLVGKKGLEMATAGPSSTSLSEAGPDKVASPPDPTPLSEAGLDISPSTSDSSSSPDTNPLSEVIRDLERAMAHCEQSLTRVDTR